MNKRLQSVTLIGLAAMTLAGCTNTPVVQEQTKTPVETPAQDEAVNSEVVENEVVTYPLTVVDQLGREVVIEKKPERIVSSYYITTSLLVALGVEERVVGIEMKADTRPIYQLAAPTFLELPAIGSGKTLNVEEILGLQADLVIVPARLESFIPQLETLGIPVLAVEPESMDEFLQTVELIGDAIGESKRADELIGYHKQVMTEVTTLTADVEDKPSVYMAGSGDVLKTPTSAMYQHSLIEMAGGTHVAAGLTDDYWATISPEELLKWNPEYIFSVSYAGYPLTAITEDAKYSHVAAVMNDQIYTFPSTMEPWDYPTPSSALGILWLVNQLHPELYSQETYVEQATGFYKYFYDITVEEADLGV